MCSLVGTKETISIVNRGTVFFLDQPIIVNPYIGFGV